MKDQLPYFEDYWVTATFADESEQIVGELLLLTIRSDQDMPTSLEINGVEYFPRF